MSKNNCEELWRDIPDSVYYEVSNKGRVRRIGKPNALKPFLEDGYLSHVMRGEKVAVHQLVAMAFLGHVRCGMKIVVDHIDGDRLNNNVSNLQLLTNVENLQKGKRDKKRRQEYSKSL